MADPRNPQDPRNPILGAIADALLAAKAPSPKIGPTQTSNMMGFLLGEAPEAVNSAAQGEFPTFGGALDLASLLPLAGAARLASMSKFRRFRRRGSGTDEALVDLEPEHYAEHPDITEVSGIHGVDPEHELARRYQEAFVAPSPYSGQGVSHLRNAADDLGLVGSDQQLMAAALDAFLRKEALRKRPKRYPDVLIEEGGKVVER